MDFDREFVLATENDIIMKDFENMSNLLFFSTSPVDEAYDNSIAEQKAVLEAVQQRNLLKVVEALEDHIIKNFKPEER